MYKTPLSQIYEIFNTKPTGLSSNEALIRLEANGKNALKEPKKKPWILKFLAQFKDFLIIILLISALLSFVIAMVEKTYSELLDTVLILIVVIINAIFGLYQENKADKALESLKNMTKPFSKILRDGKVVKIKTEDIVVGDVVVIEAGDIIPADIRLIETASLKVQESALTGESVAVDKNIDDITQTVIALGDHHNMAFMGSVATYGRGKGVVVAVGMDTQMGKIAQALNTATSTTTPLTKRINKTSKTISIIILVIAVFIFISGVLRGDNFMHSFMLAVAIAVASIPEGLPAALTLTLSVGVEQMSKQKAIIKKLPAVETLGSTQVICSDKTGTLTLNKMTVKQLYAKNMYTQTQILNNDINLAEPKYSDLAKNKNTNELIRCMLLCNDTQLKYDNDVLTTTGDPTETALVHYGFKNNIIKDKLDGMYPRVNEIPFDSDRKLMTTVHTTEENGLISYTKGAVDSILVKSSYILDKGKIRKITKKDISEIETINHLYANSALRVLAYAYKNLSISSEINQETTETDLIFIGLTGMIDPPREEVYGAIKTCKAAGITPIMITGDHKDTAFAIAKEIGIATSPKQVITGAQLQEITDEKLIKLVNKYTVYARVNPEHKVRIVKAFQAQGKIVAMTGDGVNDAPSLKEANIGVGMGISGTDVTKGVADMILTDDNFATIVNAVKEGRRIYQNILKIIQFLLTTSIAEVILMVTVIVFLGREFFSPALILYINFVTDTAVALALGLEKADDNIMKNPPVKDNGNLLLSKTGLQVLYTSIIQSILVLCAYFIASDVLGYSTKITVTMSFITLACMELFHVYNVRHDYKSIFKLGALSNKALNIAFLASFILTTIIVAVPFTTLHNALGIDNLNIVQWLIAIAFSFAIVPIMELVKVGIRFFKNKQNKIK